MKITLTLILDYNRLFFFEKQCNHRLKVMTMATVYTRQEVAEMLRVSIQTIDKEIKKGNLKRVKIGSRVLITDTDLFDYLERMKVERVWNVRD